jgi:nucleoside-diphosphate-sugar epimerase
MARVLITGGSGLIGSRLLRSIGPEHVTHAISRSGHMPSATHTIALDLSLPWSVDQLPRDVDTVVHLAQSEHFRDFPLNAQSTFAVNTQSTVKLLDYARSIGVRQFVLASSGGVYGGSSDVIREDAPLRSGGDLGFYLATRTCAELLSDCYVNYMNVVCARFFFVYGPGQQSHMLIPRLVDSIRSGRAVILRGESGLRLNPIFVDDAVLAVRQAMTLQESQKINVAGPTVLSMRDIAEEIGRVIGRAPRFEVQPLGGSLDLVADTSRMCNLLCQPSFSFRKGIEAAVGPSGA